MRQSLPEVGAGRAELIRIADTILDLESDIGELREATTDYYELCSRVVGFSDDAEEGPTVQETLLEHGRALSPRDAARCILDIARTTAFIRGVHDAIIEAQHRFPTSPIHLLYAGSGPFAPLALPMTTKFGADRLRITIIDTHEYSIDSVRKLAEHFEASAWIAGLCCCDASDYLQPATQPVHVLVIETMQKALEREPQVALTLKLAPQLADGGILIPEAIRLSAALADPSAEFTLQDPEQSAADPVEAPTRLRFDLGLLFELSAAGLSFRGEVDQPAPGPPTTELVIPDAVLEMPELMVRTTVEVFAGHRLDDYDSGISYPTLVRQLGRIRPGDRLEFSYLTSSSPGLRIRRVNTP